MSALLVVCSAYLALAQSGDPSAPPWGDAARLQRLGVGGTITAIEALTITVNTFRRGMATVKVTDRTEFRRGQQPAKLSDLKVGDTIFVLGEQKNGVWIAKAIRQQDGSRQNPEALRQDLGKRFIAGEVKKIDETKLTILRPDGETQVIEVDESTSFRNDKHESITLADIKVGDHVFGRGELKDGTFIPQILNLGDISRMGFAPSNAKTPAGAPGQPPQPLTPSGKEGR